MDGIFFSSYGGATANEVWGTMVSQGEIIRIYNNKDGKSPKPHFVVDTNGNASIQYISRAKYQVSATLNGKDYVIADVGCNIKVNEGDSTRMIYTSKFGSTLSGYVENAVAVNASGVVTAVYKKQSNVPIPSSGYLLVARAYRQWNNEILTDSKVGDKIERKAVYDGASAQNIYTAISNGPTLVKNGKSVANSATYAAEDFTDPHIISGSAARMAIGVKADGTVVIASCSCTMDQLGQVMAGLGCQSAMNLDGGASTALYYNGKWLASPGRQLTNMLVFSRK